MLDEYQVTPRRSGVALLGKKIRDPNQQEFIVCYIVINGLKTINDNFGHSVGDDLIKTSCDVFNQTINSGDMLFRLGGDEFVLFSSEKIRIKRKKYGRTLNEIFIVLIRRDKSLINFQRAKDPPIISLERLNCRGNLRCGRSNYV
ncbi:diguanylate cyclase [Bacillus sp. IITD106]|nr:diguanylate cyclase [Bacillus sp. IITD106]